jgi:hypothetical protein
VTRLPPIIAFVLHHGEAEWRRARTLRALIDLDGMPLEVAGLLRDIQPELVFVLDDLAAQTEEQLGDRATSPFSIFRTENLRPCRMTSSVSILHQAKGAPCSKRRRR